MALNEKEILNKVKRVEFDVRKVLSGVHFGFKTSLFKGQGMAFSDIREYAAGDDIRNFAWKVMAKTGRPHIKEFEEERDLEIHVALDLNASMGFGGKGLTKFEIAAYLLALFGLSASKSKDKFGGLLFSNKQLKRIPVSRGENHVRAMIYSYLEQEEKLNQVSRLDVALDYFMKLKSKNTLCILVSDFSQEVNKNMLARVKAKHKLSLIHVYDPYEKNFPELGWMEFHSPNERGVLESQEVYSSAASNFRLQQEFESKVKKLNKLTRSLGISLVSQSTQDLKLEEVIKFMRLRKLHG